MVLHQVVNGRPKDSADFHAVLYSGILQDISEIVTYGTDTIESIALVVRVAGNQVAEKVVKRCLNQPTRIINVDGHIINKLAETRAEAIGEGFGINGIHHVVRCKLVGVPKDRAHIVRHVTADVVGKQFLSDVAPTALVA